MHTSATAHHASNSTSIRHNNLLPCYLIVIIYTKLICKIIQIKFPTVCISFILVSSLPMALTAAVLQMECDRDREQLLHQMLILLQSRWVCHFAVVAIQTRLPCRTQFTNQFCFVLLHVLPYTESKPQVLRLYLIRVLNSTVPQNSVQKSQS
jgi:hypothetical protein